MFQLKTLTGVCKSAACCPHLRSISLQDRFFVHFALLRNLPPPPPTCHISIPHPVPLDAADGTDADQHILLNFMLPPTYVLTGRIHTYTTHSAYKRS